MIFSKYSDILRKKQSRNIKKVALLSLGAALILSFSGCSLIPKEKEVQAPALIRPANVNYDIKKVERGQINKKFKNMGTLEASTVQNGFFESDSGGNLKNIYVKAGDKVKKGQLLAELNTRGLDSRIKQEEIMYEKTKLTYEHLKKIGAEEYELKQTSLDLELQRLKLEECKGEAKKAKLYAAFSGTVMHCEYPKVGDFIEPLKPIVTIAEGKGLLVRGKVFADEEFHVGMGAEVEYMGKHYTGKVVAVPSATDKIIEIAVDNLPSDARFGENVNYTINMINKDDVLKVPRKAVHINEDQAYVEILENGIRVEKYVKTGIKTEDEFEIIDGLKEGDEIIVE